MYFYEGMVCPVCKQQFNPAEDVVACPHCGLPHHRTCWFEVGHCAMADKHGTEEQWSREKAQSAPQQVQEAISPEATANICSHCHTRNIEYAEFCAHCGTPLRHQEWQSAPQYPVHEYAPFRSPNTGNESYSVSEQIGAVNAYDMAAVVGQNTAYYIPRFRAIAGGKEAGWNWAAFLLGPLWLLYRKQYLSGFAFLIFQMLFDSISVYWYAPVMQASTNAQVESAMNAIMSEWLALPILILSLISLIVHILLGIKGTNLYKYNCERRIHRAKINTPDLSASELTSLGGTSYVLAIVAYFLSNMVPNIISYLTVM